MTKILALVLMGIPVMTTAQTKDKAWEHFNLQELIAEQELSQKIYLPFLNESNISAGIYSLKEGAVDHQQPHDKDEVYFILNGNSNFRVENETTEVSAGDVLFVRATLDHSFSNISQELKVLVWFSGSKKTGHDFQWKQWSAPHQAIPVNEKKNSWNVFLEVPTMITGLYSLPQALAGDSTLTHEVDEINYVIKGNAKLKIGEDQISVSPGSIVYVKAGVGHHFYDLEEDFAVYIMFEQH